MSEKRGRKAAIAASVLGLGLAFLVVLTLWTAGREAELRWVETETSEDGELATLVVEPGLGVPWVRDVGVGSDAKMHILRAGEWNEMSSGEMRRRIGIDAGIASEAGGQKVGRGYTVTVKVPQCEKWKVEIDMGEQRTIGFAMIGMNYEMSSRWESGELAGWKGPDLSDVRME